MTKPETHEVKLLIVNFFVFSLLKICIVLQNAVLLFLIFSFNCRDGGIW